MTTTFIRFASGVTILLALCNQAFALQPEDYLPRPTGVSAIQLLYTSTSANRVYRDGEKIADDFNLQQNIGVFLPVHYSTFGTMPTIFEAVIPFGKVTIDGASAGSHSTMASGFADPTFLAGIWPVNDNTSQTWWAVSGWITAPLGDYDNTRSLNLGRNQWAFKAQTGFVKGIGNTLMEVVPSIEIYADNDDFSAASVTLERAPLYSVETHLSYDLTPSVLVSLDYFFAKGGETTSENTTLSDDIETHSVQLTTRLALAANQWLNLQILKDISVETGSKVNAFSIQFTYGF